MTPLEQHRVRAKRGARWCMNRFAMNPLQPVLEHRPVSLIEQVGSNFDRVVRLYGKKEPIEGGMMQLAHCEPVRYYWLTVRIGIRHDVRRVE